MNDKADRLTDRHPFSKSIDRIDNTKGYVEGNIQIICLMLNIGKNDFSKENLFELCSAVTIKNDLLGIHGVKVLDRPYFDLGQ